MVVSHEWGVRPLDVMKWTEAELASALAYLKRLNNGGTESENPA